jgi:predicted permease
MVADAGPLLRIVSIVFPIFAVVAIGWGYARYRRTRGGIDMAFANELNMDVFVPALVISAMVTKSFELASYQWLALGAVLVMLGSGALAWGLAILLREEAKTFVPPVMFVNAGNMGLPLMVLAFGEDALPAAVVLFFVENTLHYTFGTWLLDHRARLWTLWRNPVIAASPGRHRTERGQGGVMASALPRHQAAGGDRGAPAAVFARRAHGRVLAFGLAGWV